MVQCLYSLPVFFSIFLKILLQDNFIRKEHFVVSLTSAFIWNFFQVLVSLREKTFAKMSGLGVENQPPTSNEASASKSAGKPEIKKKSGSVSDGKSGSSGRKMLQTLQPSGKNQKLLVGSDGLLRLGSSNKKKEIKIFEDPAAAVATVDKAPLLTSTPERREAADKQVQAMAKTNTAGTQVVLRIIPYI